MFTPVKYLESVCTPYVPYYAYTRLTEEQVRDLLICIECARSEGFIQSKEEELELKQALLNANK